MSRVNRYFILALLSFLFLFLSPLFIFYARGYRFDWEQKNFSKTGILDIQTQPKGAKIYLDGRLIKELTPQRIENLLPQKYMVKLEKTGYQTWQNKVEIFPERITSVDHIIFFPNQVSSRTLIQNAFLRDFKLSWDEKMIAYQIDQGTKQGLWILDLKAKKSVRVSHQSFNKLYWSSDNKRLLLQKDSQFKVLYLDNFNLRKNKPLFYIQEISQALGAKITQIVWDPKDSDRIFFLRDGTLILLNLSTLYHYTLLKNVKSFSIYGQDVYVLTGGEHQVQLVSFNLYRLDKITQKQAMVALGKKYKLFVQGENKIAYLADQKLYLIKEGKSFLLGRNIEDAQWSKDLLYYNQYEIWIYFFRNRENKILTRVSKPLNNIAWWPYSKYIIFNENKEIKFLESAEDLQHWKSYIFYQLEDLPKRISFNRYGELIWVIDGKGEKRSLKELKVRER